MLTNPDLWERLRKLQLDDPAAVFPFSVRLARDNGWSHGFALRAIEEYKRFAYLAMIAGREVTPSDEVDQVWHLHLTYTRHYWGPFTDLLGAPLHHGPTSGGASENARYEDNYDATRRLYSLEFGIDPPADIWPSAAKRFDEAPYFRRLNMKNYWRIPKPGFSLGLAGLGLLAAVMMFASGAVAEKGANPSAETDLIIALIANYWPILIVAGGVIFWMVVDLAAKSGASKVHKDKQDGSGGGAACGTGDGNSNGCGGGCGGGGCGGCGS